MPRSVVTTIEWGTTATGSSKRNVMRGSGPETVAPAAGEEERSRACASAGVAATPPAARAATVAMAVATTRRRMLVTSAARVLTHEHRRDDEDRDEGNLLDGDVRSQDAHCRGVATRGE